MQTYFDYYQESIAPKVRQLDVFLKSETQPFSLRRVKEVLQLSEREINLIRKEENIIEISFTDFLLIIKNGKSEFCQLLWRQMNHPNDGYTIEEIAYIYQIPAIEVAEGAQKQGQDIFMADELPQLFKHIILCDRQCLL